MEDEAIPEAERLQIDQTRELDYEDLQVEEVENDSSDDGRVAANGVASSDRVTFDPCLAPLHSYLGEVEDTHRRLAFLDGGSILALPMFYLEGVVLFPEAILPLRVVDANFISAVERALNQVDAPYTIGVIRVYNVRDDRRLRFANIGTTAEIRQYRRLDDGSLNVVTRGQQRFCLKRRWIDVEGVPCGEVQIIQEDLPLRTPNDAFGKLGPLSNFRTRNLSHLSPSNASSYGCGDNENDSESNSEESFANELSLAEKRIHQSAVVSCYDFDTMNESASSDDVEFVCQSEIKYERSHRNEFSSTRSMHLDQKENSENTTLGIGNSSTSGKQSHKGKGSKRYWQNTDLNQFRRVPRAFLPFWVYSMYDSYILAERAAEMWKQIVRTPSMDGLVRKPDLLSFHIASKIPVSVSTRQELLEIHGISYRLKREIEILRSLNPIRCKNCQNVIARRSDVLVMSSEGPLGAYVNQHGFVHEIMTLYRANGLALVGRPVAEYSWFPGYAWTIANCANCKTQMGWLYTATTRKLKPLSFWGVRSGQVADDTQQYYT